MERRFRPRASPSRSRCAPSDTGRTAMDEEYLFWDNLPLMKQAAPGHKTPRRCPLPGQHRPAIGHDGMRGPSLRRPDIPSDGRLLRPCPAGPRVGAEEASLLGVTLILVVVALAAA